MDKIVTLSITKKNVPVRVDVVQYATAPNIVFALDDFTPRGTAEIYIEKPSGMKVFSYLTIEDNRLTLVPTTQAFAEVGISKAQLLISDGTADAISFLIFFYVTENIIDSSAIESQDEFTALQEALNTVGQYDGRITALEGDVSGLEGDVTTIEGNVSTIQGDITTIEGDVSTLQTDVENLTSDIYYQVGETVQLNTQGAGYSTGTSGNYYFFLALPKKLPEGATITATAFKTSIRGVGGRCTNNADNLENISSTSRRVDGTLTVSLTGITNLFQANTPAHIIADITFTIS